MQWTNMHFCDFSLVDFFALGVNLFYLRLRDKYTKTIRGQAFAITEWDL